MTTGSLMKVESIEECEYILQYFWPALSNYRSWKTFFGSGHFTQVLLYILYQMNILKDDEKITFNVTVQDMKLLALSNNSRLWIPLHPYADVKGPDGPVQTLFS